MVLTTTPKESETVYSKNRIDGIREQTIEQRMAKIDHVLVREISGFLVHCSDCDKMKSCKKYGHIFDNKEILRGIGLRCTEFDNNDDSTTP